MEKAEGRVETPLAMKNKSFINVIHKEKGMSNGQHRQPNPTPSSGSIGPANPANVGATSPTGYTFRTTILTPFGAVEEAGIRAGEIRAYRAWRLGPDGLLRSMYMADYVWTPKDIEKAHDNHIAIGYGFHAYKTMERVRGEYCGFGVVYGEVALWGEVVEHEWGYRAQYAKIIRIIEVRGGMFGSPFRKAKLRVKYG